MIGAVGLLGMARLVGAAFTGTDVRTLVVWALVVVVMLGWVGYAAWRAGRSRLNRRAGVGVLLLGAIGAGCGWLGTGGAVMALLCSLLGFLVVWVHDLRPRSDARRDRRRAFRLEDDR